MLGKVERVMRGLPSRATWRDISTDAKRYTDSKKEATLHVHRGVCANPTPPPSNPSRPMSHKISHKIIIPKIRTLILPLAPSRRQTMPTLHTILRMRITLRRQTRHTIPLRIRRRVHPAALEAAAEPPLVASKLARRRANGARDAGPAGARAGEFYGLAAEAAAFG